MGALLLAAGLGSAASAQAPAGRLDRMLGGGTVPDGLGVNVHSNEDHRQDLRRIRAFGFRVVRADLLWAEVERERGTYDWRRFDALVRDVRAAGLTPLLILAYSNPLYAPRLAGQPASPSRAYAAPQHGEARAAFMRFAAAAAGRFGAQVIWEVWNEPDLNFGAPVDLEGYVAFAMDACREMRRAAPDAAVIGPAASGFAWRLLRLFLAADTAGCFDAVSIHPYRDRAPEDVLRDWASLAAMGCGGRAPCPAAVSSEWGYSVIGGTWTAERQADFVMRSYLLNLLAGVPLSILYDWQDDGPDPHDKEANFGLLDMRGEPKPVHAGLAGLVQALHGLTLMGRIDAGAPDRFVLAFGTGGVVRKLVGWTAGAPIEVLVPPRAGLPAATPMQLSSRPAIRGTSPGARSTVSIEPAGDVR